MSRPFTDITKSININPIKNGTGIVGSTVTGKYSTNNTYTTNTPNISSIASKYGNRFYNGLFVKIVEN